MPTGLAIVGRFLQAQGSVTTREISCNIAGSCLPPVKVTYFVVENTWELLEEYRLDWDGSELRIPAGFAFDLATIPRLFWRVIAPFELSIVAPLAHDFLYEYDGILPPGSLVPMRRVRRREADLLFLQLMAKEGVVLWRRILAYLAVRGFGWLWWKAD